jgi:hypothetical protein
MANRHSPNVSNVRTSIVSAIRASVRDTLSLAIRSRDVRVQGVTTSQVGTLLVGVRARVRRHAAWRLKTDPRSGRSRRLFPQSEHRGPFRRWRRRDPVRSDERVNRQSRRNSPWTRWLFHVHDAAASTTTCTQRAGVASSGNRATKGVGRFLRLLLLSWQSLALGGRLAAYASTSW